MYQRRRREVWTRLDRSPSLLRSLSRPLSPCIKPSEFVFVFCIWKSFTHQRGKVDHTLQILEIILDSPELRNLSVFYYILSWPLQISFYHLNLGKPIPDQRLMRFPIEFLRYIILCPAFLSIFLPLYFPHHHLSPHLSLSPTITTL